MYCLLLHPWRRRQSSIWNIDTHLSKYCNVVSYARRLHGEYWPDKPKSLHIFFYCSWLTVWYDNQWSQKRSSYCHVQFNTPCAYTQRMYEGMEFHTFLTLSQIGVEYLVACPCYLTYSVKTSKPCSCIINFIYFVLFIFCFINSII